MRSSVVTFDVEDRALADRLSGELQPVALAGSDVLVEVELEAVLT